MEFTSKDFWSSMKRAIQWYIITFNSFKNKPLNLNLETDWFFKLCQTKSNNPQMISTKLSFPCSTSTSSFPPMGRIIWIRTRKTEETRELCLSADNRPKCKWAAKLHHFWVEPKNPLERSNGPPSWIHGLPKPFDRLTWLMNFQLLISFKIKSFKFEV